MTPTPPEPTPETRALHWAGRKALRTAFIATIKPLYLELTGKSCGQGKASADHLSWMCKELLEKLDVFPVDKTGRWIGYIQGVMASYGLLDVDAERARTRPLFAEAYRLLSDTAHPSPSSASTMDDPRRSTVESGHAVANVSDLAHSAPACAEEAAKCPVCDGTGVERSLGRDNDEIISDCSACSEAALFTSETVDGDKEYRPTQAAEELFCGFCQNSNISSNVPANMPMQREAYMAGLLETSLRHLSGHQQAAGAEKEMNADLLKNAQIAFAVMLQDMQAAWTAKSPFPPSYSKTVEAALWGREVTSDDIRDGLREVGINPDHAWRDFQRILKPDPTPAVLLASPSPREAIERVVQEYAGPRPLDPVFIDRLLTALAPAKQGGEVVQIDMKCIKCSAQYVVPETIHDTSESQRYDLQLCRSCWYHLQDTFRRQEASLDPPQPLREVIERALLHLMVILPMAKGYASANPVGNNWTMVEEASAFALECNQSLTALTPLLAHDKRSDGERLLSVSRESFEALQRHLRDNAFAWANVHQFYKDGVNPLTSGYHQDLRVESNRLYDKLEEVRLAFNAALAAQTEGKTP